MLGLKYKKRDANPSQVLRRPRPAAALSFYSYHQQPWGATQLFPHNREQCTSVDGKPSKKKQNHLGSKRQKEGAYANPPQVLRRPRPAAALSFYSYHQTTLGCNTALPSQPGAMYKCWTDAAYLIQRQGQKIYIITVPCHESSPLGPSPRCHDSPFLLHTHSFPSMTSLTNIIFQHFFSFC